MRRSLMLLLGLVALTGCEAVAVGSAGYTAYKFANYEGPPAPGEVPTVFCYSTLGAVDCYPYPQKGQETRLVAYDGSAVTPKLPPAEDGVFDRLRYAFD